LLFETLYPAYTKSQKRFSIGQLSGTTNQTQTPHLNGEGKHELSDEHLVHQGFPFKNQ
jgi:hypothetical protein